MTGRYEKLFNGGQAITVSNEVASITPKRNGSKSTFQILMTPNKKVVFILSDVMDGDKAQPDTSNGKGNPAFEYRIEVRGDKISSRRKKFRIKSDRSGDHGEKVYVLPGRLSSRKMKSDVEDKMLDVIALLEPSDFSRLSSRVIPRIYNALARLKINLALLPPNDGPTRS